MKTYSSMLSLKSMMRCWARLVFHWSVIFVHSSLITPPLNHIIAMVPSELPVCDALMGTSCHAWTCRSRALWPHKCPQYLPTTSHIAHMHPVLTTHATTAGALASDPPHHDFMDLIDHWNPQSVPPQTWSPPTPTHSKMAPTTSQHVLHALGITLMM